MDAVTVLKGIVVGFSIAAPVGPIGVLCIRNTLAGGRLYGLASGMGAATADAIYGSIAGFGLTALSNLLVHQRGLLGVAGGVFLCYLGIRTLMSAPSEKKEKEMKKSLWGTYASTFFLTLVNPMTILSFAAVFAGLGVAGQEGSLLPAALLVSGVFIGSSLWWLTLSGAVGFLRDRINSRWLRGVNIFSGLIILSFGLAALGGFV
ncbi:MAG: lysine transporter LysE [Peptococcaceae bacterium BICA1-7]|nr:MAG: lysine transporter LysE [Peptococcaceae bacterium BICA1-7]HBV98290.1 lysine transporter LysE [Desulfotomaculum sp.]